MNDSIFTRIINGEVPCYKIYEDSKTLAFLDIQPYFPGHTLVIPKMQIDQFDDLPEADYLALFRTVRKVSKHLRTTLNVTRTVVQVFGFDVPHAHVHLMPVNKGKDFLQAIANHLTDEPYPYRPTDEELAAIAKKLRMRDEL